MAKKPEIHNQPEHELRAILEQRAAEMVEKDPELQKVRDEIRDKRNRPTITEDAKREAMEEEEGGDKFKRILEEKPVEEDIEAGKFPNLFKPKGE